MPPSSVSQQRDSAQTLEGGLPRGIEAARSANRQQRGGRSNSTDRAVSGAVARYPTGRESPTARPTDRLFIEVARSARGRAVANRAPANVRTLETTGSRVRT